jgi:hypothetical protein
MDIEQFMTTVRLLADGPDTQIDASLKERLLALEFMEPDYRRMKFLEIMDDAVYCSLVSGFVMQAFHFLYTSDLEGTEETMEIDRKHPDYNSYAKQAGY